MNSTTINYLLTPNKKHKNNKEKPFRTLYFEKRPYNSSKQPVKRGENKVNRYAELEKKLLSHVQSLPIEEKENFLDDLIRASLKSVNKDNFEPLLEVLESWDATIDLYLEPGLIEKLHEAKEEYNRGDTVEWNPSTLFN